MPGPEILSRLTPSGVNLASSHSGGVPEITAEEIAGCLAGVSLGASYYAHYLYIGCNDYQAALEREIVLELAGMLSQRTDKLGRPIQIKKPGTLRGVARLVVYELDSDFARCRQCKGTKGKTIVHRTSAGYASEWQDCKQCNGSGQRRISQRERAKVVGIDHMTWKTSVSRWYDDALRLLWEWDKEVRTAINKGLTLTEWA